MKIDVPLLLKFGEERNIRALYEEGEVYMNTIQWFKKYEGQGIGDKLEGLVEVKNYNNGKLTLGLPNNPITFENAKLQLHTTLTGHLGNIYSTYAISTLLFKRKPMHRIDKRMLNFGSHCILIKNTKKFIDSIIEQLSFMGHEVSHGLVQYRNYTKDYTDLNLFNKSHKLAYQKEHRIIAWTENNTPLKVKIGTIKDYSEVFTTSEIINNLTVQIKKD